MLPETRPLSTSSENGQTRGRKVDPPNAQRYCTVQPESGRLLSARRLHKNEAGTLLRSTRPTSGAERFSPRSLGSRQHSRPSSARGDSYCSTRLMESTFERITAPYHDTTDHQGHTISTHFDGERSLGLEDQAFARGLSSDRVEAVGSPGRTSTAEEHSL